MSERRAYPPAGLRSGAITAPAIGPARSPSTSQISCTGGADPGQSRSHPGGPIVYSCGSHALAGGKGHANIALVVSAVGVWAYQFSDVLRCPSGRAARAFLLKQIGVRQVAITLTGVGVSTLPGDTRHITEAVQGLQV